LKLGISLSRAIFGLSLTTGITYQQVTNSSCELGVAPYFFPIRSNLAKVTNRQDTLRRHPTSLSSNIFLSSRLSTIKRCNEDYEVGKLGTIEVIAQEVLRFDAFCPVIGIVGAQLLNVTLESEQDLCNKKII
jgi:hypothetical protein